MALLLTGVQLLAVWVVVPLGLGLVADLPGRRALRWTHPLGALLATAGLLLPAGPVAAVCAAAYGAWCLGAAASGAVLLSRVARERRSEPTHAGPHHRHHPAQPSTASPHDLAQVGPHHPAQPGPHDPALLGANGRRTSARLTAAALRPHAFAPVVALLSLPVAGLGMVASRGGWQLFGFKLVMLTLTSVHFHFAGFGAALIAGLTARAVRTWWAEAACATVLVSPALIGFAFFVSPIAQLPGVVALSMGVVILAIPILRSRPDALRTISAMSVLVPMVLAVWWTTGLAFDVPHLSLAWTAATHGVVNALGYTVCGLLGWRGAADQNALHRAGKTGVPTRSGV